MNPTRIPGAQQPGSPKMSRVGLSSHLPMYELSPDFTMKPANTRKGKREGIIIEEQMASPLLIPEDTA
jgi:hypothetical protein